MKASAHNTQSFAVSTAAAIQPDSLRSWVIRSSAVALALMLVLIIASSAPALAQKKKAGGSRSQAIVVLVNDEPITSYAISKRQALMGLGNRKIGEVAKTKFQSLLKRKSVGDDLKKILKRTIDANKGKSREQIIALFEKKKKAYAVNLQKRAVNSARNSVLSGLYKQALEELINERLQMQEARRNNVVASDDEVKKAIAKLGSRNKLDEKQFAAYIKSVGSDIHSMRDRIKATMSWRNVVRRQFGRQLHLSSRDIDRWTDGQSGAGIETPANASLKLQRITFALGGAFKEADFARLLQQADALRQRHTGCNATPSLVKTVSGARFEDLGTRPAGSIAEPTRTMLLSANPGEMLPASVAASGVELWVLCDKTTGAAAAGGNAGPGPGPSAGSGPSASAKAKQKDFQLMSKRKLKDLRQDAHIEYR